MSELEANNEASRSHESASQEQEAHQGTVAGKVTISAFLELSRLLATIYVSEVIAANDNRSPSAR